MTTSTAAFLVLGALTIIAVFGIGWAREFEKRVDAEQMLDESEAERLKLRAFYERHRAAYEQGRASAPIARSIDRAEFGRPRLVREGDQLGGRIKP